MDGVLVDTEPLHLRALNEVLAASGNHLSEKENEQLLGTTFQETREYLMRRFDLAAQEDFAHQYDRVVLDILAEPLIPAVGALGLLADLEAHSVPLALASSAKRTWIRATLTSLGVADYFPIVLSGEDVDRGKPAPDIFLLTAKRLRVSPPRCLVIEDSPKGIAAGRAAGMDVIAVRTPPTRHLSLSGATRIVDSLEELNAQVLLHGA
jgi:HAD superfamily hydrolase (TIGR01509 family)